MSNGVLPDVVADALAPANGSQSIKQQSRKELPTPQIAKAAIKPRAKMESTDGALVELPIGELDSKFPNARVDAHLDPERAKKMRRLVNGLRRDNAKMANGNHVRSNADAIRWLLDQID